MTSSEVWNSLNLQEFSHVLSMGCTSSTMPRG
jgi:hypothetical protein